MQTFPFQSRLLVHQYKEHGDTFKIEDPEHVKLLELIKEIKGSVKCDQCGLMFSRYIYIMLILFESMKIEMPHFVL